MNIHIPKKGIVKKQNLRFDKGVCIIYGYNNSGKTTVLKSIYDVFYNNAKEKFLLGKNAEPAVYIPTNRIVLSNAKTEVLLLNDMEDFINYQKDTYVDYSLHLKRLRDVFMDNDIVSDFISDTIYEVFDININGKARLSDGIENIINIYLAIIWEILWNINIDNITKDYFNKLLSEKEFVVLIDEIEMFLHVNIQSKLINRLKEDFPKCKFILTTHSPLLLSRYKDANIYNIEDGTLKAIEEDLYYENLDNIYEAWFEVNQIPSDIKDDINYLGNIVMHIEEYNKKKVEMIEDRISKEYPNLYTRYNKIIMKAQEVGEKINNV